jgi:RES domain-containing protein
MMMDMLKNNQEFQHKIIEMLYNQQQTIATTAAAAATAASASAAASNNHYYAESINSNNSNNNNNTFNLQFFLNEQCKDAMNLTDFASSIRLNITDLDEFGKMGYVKGMSKLFLDSLRKTELCKRPIHCSDARRETLYVKDADKWEREDSQNTKITNAVRVVEHKNIVLVNEWAKQNPKCEDSSTHENTQYINMSRAVLDGDDRNIAKVIKLVAKEVVIEKP